MKNNIFALVAKWEVIARRKFLCAQRASNVSLSWQTEKRFIEYWAMCYFNCALELKEVLSFLSPSSLATQEQDQKSKKPLA